MKLFNLLKSIYFSIKQAIMANPDIQKLRQKYPRFFGFVIKRTHQQSFWGLPLTIVVILFFYILAHFLGIIQDILASDPLAFVDSHLATLLYTFRNSILVAIFSKITILGNWQVVLGFVIAVSLSFWISKNKILILPLWLVVGGSALFSYIGKFIIHRPRPQQIAFYEIESFAFPSAHAALALALYGFIAYFLFRKFKNYKAKVAVIAVSLIIIFLIGFSRLYLGLHFLSDIIGGYLLALMFLLIGISLTEWLNTLKLSAGKNKINFFRKVSILILIIGQIFFVILFAVFYQPQIKSAKSEVDVNLKAESVTALFAGDNAWPRYSETLTAKQQEPLSFIILAKDDGSLIAAFKKSGWYLTDVPNLTTLTRLAFAAFFNKSYDNAPMTPSFWNGQVHTYGFQKPTANQTVRQRHHARFWRTNIITKSGLRIYLGTASLDEGLKWLVTHKINPNIDLEREYLFTDLLRASLLATYQKFDFVQPEVNRNFSGDIFFTDGKLYQIELK